MPSVVKASAQEPHRALREVDRLRKNPENGGHAGSEDWCRSTPAQRCV